MKNQKYIAGHMDYSQVTDLHYLKSIPDLFSNHHQPIKFLDLGAGLGKSKWQLANILPSDQFEWTGVDIGDSAEFLSRDESCPAIDLYDGINLPYVNSLFDVIWCHQVLEHVRYPDQVLDEVARILKRGGYFMGSVSQLEPYHSRSIFNWTHYGIKTVFADHHLNVLELSPGVDGITLMLRTMFGYNTSLNKFFTRESPINILVDALFLNDSINKINQCNIIKEKKLNIAGHIHFLAQKL